MPILGLSYRDEIQNSVLAAPAPAEAADDCSGFVAVLKEYFVILDIWKCQEISDE